MNMFAFKCTCMISQRNSHFGEFLCISIRCQGAGFRYHTWLVHGSAVLHLYVDDCLFLRRCWVSKNLRQTDQQLLSLAVVNTVLSGNSGEKQLCFIFGISGLTLRMLKMWRVLNPQQERQMQMKNKSLNCLWFIKIQVGRLVNPG